MTSAMIADVVPEGRRLQVISYVSASFSMVSVFSGIATSAIAGKFGPEYIVKWAGLASAMLVILSCFLCPETLPFQAEKGTPELARARAKSVVSILAGKNEQAADEAHWYYKLYWLYFVSGIPESGTLAIVMFYCQEQFDIDNVAQFFGVLISWSSVCGFMWQTLGVKFLKRVCSNECRFVQTTATLCLIHYQIFIWFKGRSYQWTVFVAGALLGPSSLQSNALVAVASEMTDPASQGRLMGILDSLDSLGSVVGPVLCSRLYSLGSLYGHPEFLYTVVSWTLCPTAIIMATYLLLPASFPPSMQVRRQSNISKVDAKPLLS